uniref:Uncharacterized protein n=1 Tax=Amphora coffeiformis TaxID=265554 RepID=A0A7S3P6R3_9STRA
MTRSGDDTSSQGGCELNDSLLDYLNDAIRQQEKKVDALVAARLDKSNNNKASPKLEPAAAFPNNDNDDALNALWNVTTTEDGQRLESLDPMDPKVKAALKDELVKQDIAETLAWEKRKSSSSSKPDTAPEQLLLLLTLLRERIKAEAVFAPDEKGRNLRLLAYCLQLSTDTERKQLISKELGNSIDRIDSFVELVSSSVEYGESTSYQLQPAKTKKPLNVRELRRILSLAHDFRTEQERRASGTR